ncbi:hypothetical protein CC80DRAFT_574428 [Byssothecium circinans]|uniref:Uncharacterized protein n=1 Tax=Byssothecium circinans TaxID=147558 RepID=A0A6A5UCW7_9PLEO|nr:hypothetical protein CC80DRAFT_574428 [Byssothecium circinans]
MTDYTEWIQHIVTTKNPVHLGEYGWYTKTVDALKRSGISLSSASRRQSRRDPRDPKNEDEIRGEGSIKVWVTNGHMGVIPRFPRTQHMVTDPVTDLKQMLQDYRETRDEERLMEQMKKYGEDRVLEREQKLSRGEYPLTEDEAIVMHCAEENQREARERPRTWAKQIRWEPSEDLNEFNPHYVLHLLNMMDESNGESVIEHMVARNPDLEMCDCLILDELRIMDIFHQEIYADSSKR